jgi:hypothetical protein
VVDLARPTLPREVASLPVGDTIAMVPAADQGYLFLAGTQELDEGLRDGYPCCRYDVLKVVDVRVPSMPRMAKVVRLPSRLTGLVLWRDRLYVVRHANAVMRSGTVIQAYDIVDPADPRPLGQALTTTLRAGSPAWLAPGAYLVMSSPSGLLPIDVTVPGRPELIEPVAAPLEPYIAGIASGRLWTWSPENGLTGWRLGW